MTRLRGGHPIGQRGRVNRVHARPELRTTKRDEPLRQGVKIASSSLATGECTGDGPHGPGGGQLGGSLAWRLDPCSACDHSYFQHEWRYGTGTSEACLTCSCLGYQSADYGPSEDDRRGDPRGNHLGLTTPLYDGEETRT